MDFRKVFTNFLEDRVILVTGASRGIGFTMAKAFRDCGAKVYGTVRTENAFTLLNQEGILPIYCDVRKEEDLKNLFLEIYSKEREIHTLVNNAGFATYTPASLLKNEEVELLVNTNFTAVFRTCQLYYQNQKKKGGNIINLASVLGLVGSPLASVYCGTKGAIIQLTKALALEWARNNFRINAIAPGFIDTDMTETMKKRPQVMEEVLKNIPLNRMGKPEDIAGMALFLSSEAASYITGQVFVVDGGLTAQ